MGLVFDPERVGEGKIPAHANGQAQVDAALILGESLSELVTEIKQPQSEILAYMLYGSAAEFWKHTTTRRSDVDLLAVVDDDDKTSSTWQAIGERITAVENAFHIDVNPTLYSRQELEGPVRINPFYAEHLCLMRGLVSNPSLQYFQSRHRWNSDDRDKVVDKVFQPSSFVDAWPFAIEYLRVRREQFQTQLDQTQPHLTALKGPFELPRNLGRTIGDLFIKYIVDHSGVYDDLTSDADVEAEALISAIDAAPYHEQLLIIAQATEASGLIGEDVERLHELDSGYTNLLEATIAGDTTITDYERWLKSVYVESFERAFKIADLADAIVRKTVDLAKLHPNYDQVPNVDAETLMYPEELPSHQQFVELKTRGTQVVPVSYNIDRLLFDIAPKYPDLAERYDKLKRDAKKPGYFAERHYI